MERLNEIKIGKQDFRFYVGQCAIKFRTNDQIVLVGGEGFKEKILYVFDAMSGLGVEVEKDYKNKGTKKIELAAESRDVEDEKTGRVMSKKFYRLGLTKIPELFMFTDPEKPDIELE